MTPNATQGNAVVLFEEIPLACGRRFGIATLNAPAALNALSLPMVQLLIPALTDWENDADIAGVVLQAAGEKAFCAGGDLSELYKSMLESGAGPNPYAHGFFAQEYQLDSLIHTYSKPLLCWANGYVMGGGIGLLAGASHRVVTSTSRLAMPEISIGLYPDVGASWFLKRMPGRVGLFLALTAAPLNAADALFCGLANHAVGETSRDEVLAAIARTHWLDSSADNRLTLSKLLAGYSPALLPESKTALHLDEINRLMKGSDLLAIAHRLRELKSGDPWLQSAAATFIRGSPTSAALSFELCQRVENLSLAEVFRLEYRVSLGCCAHPDFAEGIRALIIDKDRSPRWTPERLEHVTPEWIAEHFEARFAAVHPIAVRD